MNNRKKIISMLLVIVMIVSVFTVVPISASAAEADPALTGLTSENAPDFDYELNENDTALITGYSGEGGDIEIPSVIDGYEVWDIGCQAFADCTAITSVTFPETLKGIAEGAFSGCTGLEEITLPRVTEIGKDAFAGCTNLIYVTILDSPETIDPSAFPANGLTFYGYSRTSVETYADDYGFTFVSMGVATPDESVPSISTSDEVDPDTCPEIKLGEVRTVNIKRDGEYAFLKFVAEKNATIVFTSKANEDTYGYLYNDKMNLLTSDDDGGIDSNFKITYDVTAGRTYFFGARFYSRYQTGIFDVALSEQQLWEHDGETLTGYNGTSSVIEIPAELDGVAITRIGDYAFYERTDLTSVTIPDSVTSIGAEAFYGCTGLKNIDIPDSVKEIGWEAFYGCTALASVTIPDSVTEIGESVFRGCIGLTSVTIPDSVTEIDRGAFYDCTGLMSVVIPDSVTSIGSYAFYGCTALASITIPDSITEIGYSAFENTAWYNNQPDGIIYVGKIAYQLKGTCPAEVTIKNGTVSIGDSLFLGCSGLTSITIPDSVTTIGNDAFLGCSGLTRIDLPDSVTAIGWEAFGGCTGLTEFTIPSSVTRINWNTFISCTNLESVTIPSSVTRIERFAFSHCTALTTVHIPEAVTYIASGDAFSGCTGLTSITVDPDNPVYDSRDNCNAIIRTDTNMLVCGCQNTVIPDSVTNIGYLAFSGCTGLTGIKIPASVTQIGSNAFNGCTGLTSVTIPDSVKTIYSWAFSDCTGLTSIFIPASVSYLSEDTFAGCCGLTSITVDPENPVYDSRDNCNAVIKTESDTLILGCQNTVIPDTVTVIGESAFRGCTGLTSIEIPDSVTEISSQAFSDCTGLRSVTIPDSVTYIGWEAFSGCTGLTSVEIPDSVTEISSEAFYGCSGLRSVTFSDSVREIGWEAFYNCPALTSVAIPASVDYIGGSAFGYYQESDNGHYQTKKVDGFTICGELGSEAERYANDNGFNFDMTISVPVDDIIPISLNETVTFGDNEKWTSGVGYLKFTPEEDMKVTFSSSQAGEARGYLLNEDKELLAYQDGQDNNEYDPYFTIHYEVEAGNTYYLAAVYTGYKLEVTLKEFTEWEYYVSWDDTAEITRYNGDGGDVTVPSSLDGYPVTAIGSYAFRKCAGLTSVTIPDSVNDIYYGAFYNCSNLTNVIIPDAVEAIGSYAFYGCTSLTSVTIPDSVMKIGDLAFGYYYDEENDEVKKVDGFTIYGSHGSAAEAYAYQNGFDFVATASIPADAFIEVKLNETATVYAEESSGIAYFKFTPEQDVDFLAFSSIWGSSYGYLYDSDMNLLVYDDGSTYGDDMFDRFRIRYMASAGETYYLAVRYALDLWNEGEIIDALTIKEYRDFDYNVLEDGTAEITNYNGDDSEVVIPATIDGYTVTGISDYAFYYACHDQKSVTIPVTITRIGERAIGYGYYGYYDDFTIYGYANTVAETYADDNNFNFVSLGALSILGDATGDGQITVMDATAVQYYLAGLSTPADALRLMNADVDRNGLLEIIDVTYILRHIVGIEIPYDVGSVIENNSSSDGEWTWPTPGNFTITSAFGEGRSYETHGGVDIGASAGDLVFAANAGTVVSSYNGCTHVSAGVGGCDCGGGYGNYVWILHNNGYETIYAHLISTAVSVGETVQNGQLIGYVGSSGWSTGPHLHFELRINGVKTNPINLY